MLQVLPSVVNILQNLAVVKANLKSLEQEHVPLVKLSPQDSVWDRQKKLAVELSQAFSKADMDHDAERILNCAETLDYVFIKSNEGIKMKLHNAKLCHDRHCPICAWRRGLKLKAILYNKLPAVIDRFPTSRWLYMVLTVKNVDVSDLRNTLNYLNRSRERLIKRKAWPAIGYICATEVTLSDQKGAHPHFNLLMQVPASYFTGHGYLNKQEWIKLWREAARLDYDPNIYIKPIKPSKKLPNSNLDPRIEPLLGSITELIKYSVKATDLLNIDPKALAEYTGQVRNLKFVTSGGSLRNIFKTVKLNNEDLVHINDTNNTDTVEGSISFGWQYFLQQYTT